MSVSSTPSSEIAALVSACPTALLLVSPELRVVSASDEFLRLFGISGQDVIGRPLGDTLAGVDSAGELMAAAGTAMRLRQPRRMAPGLFRVPGGGDQAAPRRLSIRHIPVQATTGDVLWLMLETREFVPGSESPKAEIALEVAEARLSSILRTVPDAMIIIDELGKIETLSATAERMFGFSADEAVGRNISLFMPAPHRERHDDYLLRYLATGEKHIIGIGRVVMGQRKDGTTFPMHLSIGEMRTGGRHYFTGFIRDLTDQQLTEHRLRELQAEVTHMSRFTALGEMASTLAHEINQPLTAITNYLKGCHRLLGQMSGEPVSMVKHALAQAADQALRAGQIIRRLREFVARGDTERRIENLPKLIEDASTLALVGTRENGIAVSFRLDPQAADVLVDRIQIQQVLVNLIRNAVEVLTEKAGERTLAIETQTIDNGLVQVSVADSGAGLAPEVSAQLFQPFVTTKQKGMGLGLSICRTIVEAHGGKIWVEERPGGGTVFRFTLRVPGKETEEAGLGEQ